MCMAAGLELTAATPCVQSDNEAYRPASRITANKGPCNVHVVPMAFLDQESWCWSFHFHISRASRRVTLEVRTSHPGLKAAKFGTPWSDCAEGRSMGTASPQLGTTFQLEVEKPLNWEGFRGPRHYCYSTAADAGGSARLPYS